jgi:Tfp pilus assembly protein FimT
MIEVVFVVAIVSILMAVSTPMLLSYWRTSTLRAGAEELSAILNGARMLAIKENSNVCVTNTGTAAQYHVAPAPCGGTAWTGIGTDSAGNFRLANNVTVTGGVSVTFNYLGASTPGTYTVRNPVDGRTMSVIVASTGRVRIGP